MNDTKKRIIEQSRKLYGRPRREVERMILKQMGLKMKRKKTRRKLRRKRGIY